MSNRVAFACDVEKRRRLRGDRALRLRERGRDRDRRVDHHPRRGLPEPEHEVRPHRVEVRRPAGQVQGAEHLRPGRVGQVQHVERVDLSVGHHHGGVAEPPHRAELLARPEPVEPADLHEPPGVGAEQDDRVRRAARRSPRRPRAARRPARPSTSWTRPARRRHRSRRRWPTCRRGRRRRGGCADRAAQASPGRRCPVRPRRPAGAGPGSNRTCASARPPPRAGRATGRPRRTRSRRRWCRRPAGPRPGNRRR